MPYLKSTKQYILEKYVKTSDLSHLSIPQLRETRNSTCCLLFGLISLVTILTILAMLSWSPKTRFNSLPLNQLTAYVFWATAKDSPPILKIVKGRKVTAFKHILQVAILTLLLSKGKQSL